MIRINQIKIANSKKTFIQNKADMDNLIGILKNKVAKELKIDASDIGNLELVRHSIDARKKPEIYDIYMVDVTLLKGNEEKVLKKARCKNADIIKKEIFKFPSEGSLELKNRPVVVGAGPAGLFCAYELALHGYKPILLERGADVDSRQEAVNRFWKTGVLDTTSNVQFGEGGAGTFSDGKLNTMVKDKDGRGKEALKIFVEHGASEDILYESKPHIGTDVLAKVVKNIREDIKKLGGEVYFNTQVTGLELEKCDRPDTIEEAAASDLPFYKITGVKTPDRSYKSETVVLAIGHSARDTFYTLNDQGVFMEPKAFAVGFRVEHPQTLINKSQYGIENPETLPPSPYKVVSRASNGRGVYSFCMCPGGYVVNASSEEGMLAVNGMSYHDRAGHNANSAIIVSVTPEDFGQPGPLAGVEFQRRLEKKAFEIGSGDVPVEYFDDFKKGLEHLKNGEKDYSLGDMRHTDKEDRNKPQIRGKYRFADVHNILPLELTASFAEGMDNFGHMIKGYDNDEAIIDGIESRTSSPVRITRSKDYQSLNVHGLYPCGEGAGYAGGITSAAMDGIKVAEIIAMNFKALK
ncbi:MAG: FAD-binding protein [Butyrivibrio sp.]|nr:FAD-binding protein [Butyrivibrio sp.]